MNEPLNLVDKSNIVEIYNQCHAPKFILLCEHASNFIPTKYNNLGLEQAVLNSHIAWDPGALNIAEYMAKYLESPLIFQKISRLVYDCNRPPSEPSAMPTTSEIYQIPGNKGLTQVERDTRTSAYYDVFCDVVSKVIDDQITKNRMPIIVTIHTFTPQYFGKKRDLDIGFLHDDDHRLVDAILDTALMDIDLKVARNQPYGPADGVTHSLKIHAESRNLLNVMIEIRNDLAVDATAQKSIAKRLSNYLISAMQTIKTNQ